MKIELLKDMSTLVEQPPVDQGWYYMEISSEPTKQKNKKETGINLIFPLRIKSDDPDTNGRKFRYLTSYPIPKDMEREFDGGVTLYDLRAKELKHLYATFTNQDFETMEGVDIEFTPGMGAYFFLEKKWMPDKGRHSNFIPLNVDPRAELPSDLPSNGASASEFDDLMAFMDE